MQRRILTFANIVQRLFPLRKAWMVTLTFAPEVKWSAEQITRCVNAYRAWCDRQGVECLFEWVMEPHKSGLPHYHLCVWLPRHLQVPKFDTRGWWPHGMTQRLQARFAPGYLAKYVAKGTVAWETLDIPPPKGARIHGTGGLKGQGLIELRWWLLPRWMRESVEWMGQARRVKGGWQCKQTGEFFPTPYEVMFTRGIAWFRRKSVEFSPSPMLSASTL